MAAAQSCGTSNTISGSGFRHEQQGLSICRQRFERRCLRFGQVWHRLVKKGLAFESQVLRRSRKPRNHSCGWRREGNVRDGHPNESSVDPYGDRELPLQRSNLTRREENTPRDTRRVQLSWMTRESSTYWARERIPDHLRVFVQWAAFGRCDGERTTRGIPSGLV